MKRGDIVAFHFLTSGLITNDRQEILERMSRGEKYVMVKRARVLLMAAADLGEAWRRLATAPALITEEQLETLLNE